MNDTVNYIVLQYFLKFKNLFLHFQTIFFIVINPNKQIITNIK